MNKLFILCTPRNQTPAIEDLLHKFSTYSLPLLNLVFDEDKLKYLEEKINSVDYLIITSPSVIEKIAPIIRIAKHTQFITVGIPSSKKLQESTSNLILYPKLESGKEALVAEILSKIDFRHKKVVLLSSDNSNNDIFLQICPHLEVITLYNNVRIYPELKELHNLLNKDEVTGIVITSTILVDELISIIWQINCEHIIEDMLFIVIHEKIAKKLRDYGAKNIKITKSADKQEILQLIENLNV